MTHLHAGALASKCESRSDREYAADELDNGIAHGLASFTAAYRGLDLWYAATSRIWRDPTDQPRRNRRGSRCASDDKQEPHRPLAMRQRDEPAA